MITMTCPEVADTARMGVCEASRQLEIDRKTMLGYLNSGLVRFSVNRVTKRKIITGREVKRIWKILTA